MVKLTKIYTKTGDAGQTGLGDGSRRPKADLRVEAYGEVDEANAVVGLAAAACQDTDIESRIAAMLIAVQQDLFDVGADLCTPITADEEPGAKLRITPAQTQRLEHEIDQANANLAALTSFVLPGGTELAARLHIARTVTRRAERRVAQLIAAEPDATNAQTMVYLNRLSDLFFVLARIANAGGAGDVLWKPGANR